MTFPALDIDEVVVVLARRFLVAHPPGAEIMARQDALALQQPHRPVHRRQRDAVVDGVGAPVHFLHVGMIGRVRQDARDDAALPCHAQTEFGTELLDPAQCGIGSAGHGFEFEPPVRKPGL